MRLGALEKRVLAAILESRDAPEYRPRFTRYGRRPGAVILIDVRDRLWGRSVTASQRASLSRALRTLEEKGLIRSLYHTMTAAELTPEGEQEARSVNNVARATKLTPQEGAVNNIERSTMLTSREAAP